MIVRDRRKREEKGKVKDKRIGEIDRKEKLEVSPTYLIPYSAIPQPYWRMGFMIMRLLREIIHH